MPVSTGELLRWASDSSSETRRSGPVFGSVGRKRKVWTRGLSLPRLLSGGRADACGEAFVGVGVVKGNDGGVDRRAVGAAPRCAAPEVRPAWEVWRAVDRSFRIAKRSFGQEKIRTEGVKRSARIACSAATDDRNGIFHLFAMGRGSEGGDATVAGAVTGGCADMPLSVHVARSRARLSATVPQSADVDAVFVVPTRPCRCTLQGFGRGCRWPCRKARMSVGSCCAAASLKRAKIGRAHV